MRLRKTRQDERNTYTYKFYDEKGNEEKIIIRPGENGVTEADIKMLHAEDDSEVYYNNKNLRPERTEEEKAEIRRWEEEYISNAIKEHGYAPTDDEVKVAAEEVFPKNYNLSFNYDFGEDGEDTDYDQSSLMYQAALASDTEESYETQRFHELMEQMTEKQREVLQLVLDGWSLTDISKLKGISVKNVSKHRDNAMKYIKENFYK